MSRFDPEFYRRFRPLYPAQLFAALPGSLRARGLEAPFRIADIGCGTGHSALSLLKAGVPVKYLVGVDPDPRMLAHAGELIVEQEFEGLKLDWREGRGEAIPLPDASADAVLVGSALHWMEPEATRDELLRILAPGGVILAFEYQFPKCAALPELNEWIRREFNLRWKAPSQSPRGDFEHVTSAIRDDARIECLTLPGEVKRSVSWIPMRIILTSVELHGLILSQSRVLHFEETLHSEWVAAFRNQLLDELGARMPEGPALFDFKLCAAAFGLRTFALH